MLDLSKLLRDETVEQIQRLRRHGLSLRKIAAEVGVHPREARRWAAGTVTARRASREALKGLIGQFLH